MNYKLGIVCLLLATNCYAKFGFLKFAGSSKKATSNSKHEPNPAARPTAQKAQVDKQMKPMPSPFGGTVPPQRYVYMPLGVRIAKAKMDAMKSGKEVNRKAKA